MRLQKFSNQDFIRLAGRFVDRCTLLMERACAGSSDALKFGWDWPTFSMYFPDRYRRWCTFCKEARRRGIARASY